MRIHILLALCSSVLFAQEPNDALISEIMANENVCVRAYVEDKIYLDSERIVLTKEGLFLNLTNRHYIPLPTLYSDQGGCYVLSAPSGLSDCPHCGERYFGLCTNRDCQGKANIKKHEEEQKRKKDEYKRKKQEEKIRK